MPKIKLSESQLNNLIKKVIKEQDRGFSIPGNTNNDPKFSKSPILGKYTDPKFSLTITPPCSSKPPKDLDGMVIKFVNGELFVYNGPNKLCLLK